MGTMDQIHRGILRKFHTLCSKAGLTPEEKQAIIASHGVESSADIDTHALIDICNKLEKQITGGKGDLHPHRRRVFAAIGGYLDATGQESNAAIIKGIACRATGFDKFNDIPKQRLINLYNAFRNKQKDLKTVESIVDQISVSNIIAPQPNSIIN